MQPQIQELRLRTHTDDKARTYNNVQKKVNIYLFVIMGSCTRYTH